MLVVMPDAMGLPPGFMGLLALAIGFPRTCGQRVGVTQVVPRGAWEGKRRHGGGVAEMVQQGEQRESGRKWRHELSPDHTNASKQVTQPGSWQRGDENPGP